MSKSARPLLKITYAAICLALALLLPLLTFQQQPIGNALCPMHLPVLLCGFLCGWPYGLAVGCIAPLLRFLLFGMPPLMPIGLSMSFELATYGAMAGILYSLLPKKYPYLYLSLISSMLLGRIVWGFAQFFLNNLQHTEFPFSAFLSGAFITALPGILLQILLIPPILLALKKAKLLD